MRRLAVVAVFGLCACGAPAPKPTVLSNHAVKPAEPVMPVAGAWSGVGHQFDNGQNWPVRIHLHPGKVGEPIGLVEYPSYACSSTLTRNPDDPDGSIVATETMALYNASCVDGTMLHMRREGDQLHVQWIWSGMPGVNADATLTLR